MERLPTSPPASHFGTITSHMFRLHVRLRSTSTCTCTALESTFLTLISSMLTTYFRIVMETLFGRLPYVDFTTSPLILDNISFPSTPLSKLLSLDSHCTRTGVTICFPFVLDISSLEYLDSIVVVSLTWLYSFTLCCLNSAFAVIMNSLDFGR
jgi:hypothetical protein